MLYHIIPVPDENDSYFRYVLDNVHYNLRFTWNDMDECWKFGVYTSLGEPIVLGMKIVPEFPVNIYHTTEGLPRGVFEAKTNEPRVGRKDFINGKAQFIYISVEENLKGIRDATGS